MSIAVPAALRPTAAEIPVPEPHLTPRELIARATAMRSRLREAQAENDERGGYGEDLFRAFDAAGFYRITQPRRFGGYEFDMRTFYKAMVEISRGHPGVGWCLTLAASHAFVLASHWPERGQRELFAPDGLFVCPARAVPFGTATPAEGGFRISGTWNYCSGSPFSTHFMGHALVKREGHPPSSLLFVVPRTAYEILPDWGGDQTLGMQASGSNSIRVDDAFVPEHHTIPKDFMFARPEDMLEGTPGTRLHGNPMYLGRLMGPFHASLVSTVVGAAWAAIDEFENILHTTRPVSDPSILRVDHADSQRPLGMALGMVDAAEAALLGVADRYMELCERWAADGTPISVEDNLRMRGMAQHAGRMACDVVEMLFHAASSSATKRGNRLQRYFRDVQMYRSHSSAQYLDFATLIARAHLGREIGFRGL
ncbi:acyl-CoA dehydrogenase family protein [Roseomonas chloroacetimidivorans]|jgi:3-hydroxy-9,10-secoandrosta-1,3,5(10)-triene-9,17-dione monooxygenase|uniref:acyl-CoA dehydrogenase family protein n=1 Tax=Roseomonas chloroacetimidivorans TaxID=1766656 RepID=UPI003C73A5D8